MACPLASERIWLDKAQYSEAERKYYETLSSKVSYFAQQFAIDSVAPCAVLVGSLADPCVVVVIKTFK